MTKLLGEAAVAHARQFGAQLYHNDKAVDLREAVRLCQREPSAISCEQAVFACPGCNKTYNLAKRCAVCLYCVACHREAQ